MELSTLFNIVLETTHLDTLTFVTDDNVGILGNTIEMYVGTGSNRSHRGIVDGIRDVLLVDG